MRRRFLFFKHALEWPRASGHDVHTAGMMRALAALGHEVHLVSKVPPTAESIAGLGLASARPLAAFDEAGSRRAFRPPSLQARFFAYWGIAPDASAALAAAADTTGADTVVASGLDAPLYLAGITGAERVWYAADEWVLHHLSQVAVAEPTTWGNVRQALVKGLYERAFAPTVDQVWVVSEPDRRWARWLAGFSDVAIIPNGVDAAHFAPRSLPEQPESAIFWGRLDFGPNVQALQWFLGSVWPEVRRRRPGATLSVLGFRAGSDVARLCTTPGVTLRPGLADIRDEICRHQVAIVPMVSGAGIKNKLLEAASLGRPILCTSRATLGLSRAEHWPLVVRDDVGPWASALEALWADPARRAGLGRAARAWVRAAHSWESAARLALSAGRAAPTALGATA